MQKWSPLVSALVVTAYLLAAFIDCEGSLIFAFEMPGVGERVHSMPTPMPMSESEMQPTASKGGHAHATEHAPAGVHERAPRSIAGSTLELKTLELKPKCGCGCSETRSTVGGNTSRLGSVIPSVHVARLLVAASTGVADRAADLVLEIYADPDPIPT